MPHGWKSGVRSWGPVGCLVVLLGLQVSLRERPQNALPEGPLPGMLLPSVDITLLESDTPSVRNLHHITSETDACTLLVVVSTTCPVCSRMRVTWPAKFAAWRDTLDTGVRSLWLAIEGKAELAEFVRGSPVSASDIDFATFAHGLTREAYNSLGILGTPTLYLVDRGGRVQAGLLGDVLPPVELARSTCG